MTTIDPHKLADLLGVDLDGARATGESKASTNGRGKSTSSSGARAETEEFDLDSYPTVRAAVNKNSDNRSKDIYGVMGACCRANLTFAQACWAVYQSDRLAERLEERREDDEVDLQRCWVKVIDDRQREAQKLSQAGQDGGVKVWNALDLKPAEQPRWLAKSRLPRGAVSLLLGDEGIGKSLFWVLLAARITTGKPFAGFGIPACEPALVVVVCTEDDWSSVVRPRLEAAGAGMSMVKVICSEDDGSGAPVFPDDIGLIDGIDPAPAMVVVDCWLDTVPAAMQVRDPQQARQALHPWKESATRTGAAVLLLGHTNRVASTNPRDRYGGTYALRQKARMTLFAQLDEDGHLQVGPEKANAAAILPASTFKIDTVPLFSPTAEHDGMVPVLTYVGESAKTAHEHLVDNYAAQHDTAGNDDAVAWLAAYLAGGPRWSNDVHEAREEAGISKNKLSAAKKRLHVESARVGGDGPWFMRLTGQGDPEPEAHQEPTS